MPRGYLRAGELVAFPTETVYGLGADAFDARNARICKLNVKDGVITAERYKDKISGPLLDRMDIHIEVQGVEYAQLSGKQKEEPSEEIQKRVNKARAVQLERFKGTNITCNAKMTPAATQKYCILSESANAMLERSFKALDLSPRAYDKILRISRTIADLEESEKIELPHIAEAIQYRSLDRKYWR